MVMNQNKKQAVKVVHSVYRWLPQTQTWLYSQVKQLQKLDGEIYVACEDVGNLDQFKVDNIHSFSEQPLLIRLWDEGLRKYRVRPHLKHLERVGNRTGAHIIHSHFGNIAWANLGAIRRLKVKHVVTFYGMDVNKLPNQDPIWRKRYTQLFSEVDRVLCEGLHMAACIVKLGCPEDKVKVQHLGIDIDKISFKPRQWQFGSPLRVLIAASFREKKGIPYAIKALGVIAREIPVQLTIIGDSGGDEESQQEKKIILEALNTSSMEEKTRLLGYQSHQILLQEAYQHHLFLQPSITAKNGDTEGGAPVAIIEMMATGMPVVATTHCDIPEVVGPALSHLLAPERDVLKLVGCIKLLLEMPESWPALLEEGRVHVERDYHLLRQAESLMEHYKEILKQ